MNTQAIATHLNILDSAITKIEEWATVIFVVAKGIGARFVSKKILVKQMRETSIDKAPSHWTVRFHENGNPSWVAINAKGVAKVSGRDAMLQPPTQEMIDHALNFVPKFINWKKHQDPSPAGHSRPNTGYAKKLNPDWSSYNNLVNEGGEGYNPHRKYI